MNEPVFQIAPDNAPACQHALDHLRWCITCAEADGCMMLLDMALAVDYMNPLYEVNLREERYDWGEFLMILHSAAYLIEEALLPMTGRAPSPA